MTSDDLKALEVEARAISEAKSSDWRPRTITVNATALRHMCLELLEYRETMARVQFALVRHSQEADGK